MKLDTRWLFPGLGLKRWIGGFIVGVLLISLGIGYFLVTVYRSAPLPEVFYWLTLQFLDRAVRGVLFMGLGLVLTLYSIYRINLSLLKPFLEKTGDDSLVDIVYRHNALSNGPKVVAISGGPGLSILLSGLKNETGNLWGITLGHGPKRTRSELGLLQDRVIQASDDDLHMVARLGDGTKVDGESAIVARRSGDAICRLDVRRHDGRVPDANPAAVELIHEAEAIIIGPGDLWTTVIPPLRVPEISDAIRESKARKVFVCNIMTQAGKTTAYSVADHVRAVQEAGNIQLDYVIVNNKPPVDKLLSAYKDARQSQVVFDPKGSDHLSQVTFANTSDKFVLMEGAFLVEADIMTDMTEELLIDLEGKESHRKLSVVRHDPKKLGDTIANLIRSDDWRLKAS